MNKQNYDGITFNQLAERNAEHVTAIARLEAQVKQLAAENAALKDWAENRAKSDDALEQERYSTLKIDYRQRLLSNIQTPATDAMLASLRAEGINFAASRLAAAYNHGFIDKPLAEVGDVVRMILTAKEDLANNPAADGLSGQYAEIALAEWESQLRSKSEVQS